MLTNCIKTLSLFNLFGDSEENDSIIKDLLPKF